MMVNEVTPDLSQYEAEQLTLADRCDDCKAQAFFRFLYVGENVTFKGNGDLLFCGHHGNKYKDALESQGFVVAVDTTDTINVKPSISANAE